MTDIKKPELLSPAGSMESLKAAVNNGCNAVYLGGKQFSARAFAGNFSLEELEEACDYCHLRGVKVYVTVNTLYKDKELEEFLQFTQKLYTMGVDALIVQDLGAAQIVKDRYPNFPLHASTQLTTNSLEDVQFLTDFGFSKIVLSRELNLKEIKDITKQCPVEIETFIHGALCVSYSGQCIMSSMLGGRSGNRGRCAQPCRLPYELMQNSFSVKEGHLLCPKDMETISILPQLIESGVTSFKIEGRMKNPVYVAGVTKIYRKYIDLYFEHPEAYKIEEADYKILLQLFNRNGFSHGYYDNYSGSKMMSIERPKSWGVLTGFVDDYNTKIGRLTIRTREPLVPGDGIEIWTQTEPHSGSNINKASKPGEVITLFLKGNFHKNDPVYKTHNKALEDMLDKTWEKDVRKKGIFGSLKAKNGEPAALRLWTDNSVVYVTGEVVTKAENRPLTAEQLQQQIGKMGATPFYLEQLDIDMEDGIYVNIKALNELRRKGTDALAASILKKSKRFSKVNQAEEEKSILREKAPLLTKKKLTVLVNTAEQLTAAIETPAVGSIYFELNDEAILNQLDSFCKKCRYEGKKLFAALPRIYRQQTKELYKNEIQQCMDADIDGFLVRSPGEYALAAEWKKECIIDYSLNPFNQKTIDYWQSLPLVSRVTISPEMNLEEIVQSANEGCEMVIYGYLPLMTTVQCPVGSFAGDKEKGIYCLKRNHKEPYYLKDRKNIRFPVMTDCKQCIASILNSKPLFTLKFFDEILESPTGYVRLQFTRETINETKNLLKAYSDMLKNPYTPSVDAQLMISKYSELGSTKGQYFRGVE